MTKIEKAFLYACRAHKGTKRKGFNQEYIFHPLEVLNLASIITDDEDVLCAALLHDTVEDTLTSVEDINNEFGERVANLVKGESEDKKKDKSKKDTWIIRKQETIDRLAKEKDLDIKIICLCDKVSNLRSFQLLYFDMGENMWNLFNNSNPKQHRWYYENILNNLSELKDTAVYKEMDLLIHNIFDRYL